MGCDIHMCIEAQRSINDDLRWCNIDNWRVNRYFKTDEDEREFNLKPLYGERDYEMFSLLAGVRDYSEQTKPVSEPKGIPEDMSEYTREQVERWDGDGHTHSWLILSELKAYQATGPVINHSGLISFEQAKDLERGIYPTSWCQGTSATDVVRKTWSRKTNTLLNLISLMEERLKEEFWVYSDDYDPELDEKIRIVFWFDN